MTGNDFTKRQPLGFRQKLQMKRLRRAFRRYIVESKYGSLTDVPIIFANSFPKSGTHLLVQVLGGFAELGPVVDTGLPAVVTFDGPTGRQRPLDHILNDLRLLEPGDMAYGHLHAFPEVISELVREGVAAYFIYRDPRDVVVSHAFYVTEMESRHVHHHYYRYELSSLDERLMASILGRPELSIPFPDIRERFDPYLGWLNHPDVLSLRFEDFITDLPTVLGHMWDHAVRHNFPEILPRDAAIKFLETTIQPEKSPTYRSGRVGGWQKSFSAEHKAIFKEVAGDLLIRLGYEQSNDW